MKTVPTALAKAVAIMVWVLITGASRGLAADATSLPPSKPSSEMISTLSDEENAEINNKLNEAAHQGSAQQLSQQSSGSFSIDDQIPIGVIINGIPREDGFTVYLPSGATPDQALIPLTGISSLLSYAITVNAGDKKAEGFFEKEKNTFNLDLNTREIIIAGKKEKIGANEAVIQDGDILVRIDALRKWFGIDAMFDLSNLELVLKTDAELPFQERLKRQQNAKNIRTYNFDAIKPENAVMAPYRDFSFPSLYVINSTGVQSSTNDRNLLGTATLQGYQDLARFEADYTISGQYLGQEGQQITGSRMTLSRRDPLKKMFGPMKAGRISIGDVYYPSVPLFGSSGNGAGIEISSDSSLGIRYVNNSEDFILEGDAPIGYDAELYRNGVFTAFQQIGPDGRYRFENLELPAGYNTFEIILYGPQGQKTSIKRDVTRGTRQLRKGELQYDLAAGLPKSDFLPFAENAQDDRTPGASGQLFYGFTNFFTMGVSAFNGPQTAPRGANGTEFTSESTRNDNDFVRTTGAAVSSALSFMGINFRGQLLGADEGRQAYDMGVDTRFMGANIGAGHTVYKNFLEENQELAERTELFVGKTFKGFNTSFRFQKRAYLEREDEISLEHILSFNLKGVRINNDLIRTISKDEGYDEFEGELTALAGIAGMRVRGALIYNLSPDQYADEGNFRRLSFSGQKRLTSRSSFRFEGAHDFDAKLNTLNLRYSRDYDKFGLDFDAVASSDNNYIFTIGTRLALQPDQKNHYRLVDPVTGGQASLGLRAFIDNNNNNIFDTGDAPLEGIEFRGSGGSAGQKTDKGGIIYAANLSETPTRFKVVTESIPDIYLAPKFDHRDLIPRRGSTPIIDFPFVKMSEISGYLVHLKRGLEGVVVRLINGGDGSEVEKTETDSDGYFIFPAVKGGNYKIAFGLPDREFMSLNVDLDVSIEDPEEMKIEASDELAKAAEEAATIRTSFGSSARQQNLDRLDGPAGAMPNIDDPLSEEDLKELDEKAIEGIITQ